VAPGDAIASRDDDDDGASVDRGSAMLETRDTRYSGTLEDRRRNGSPSLSSTKWDGTIFLRGFVNDVSAETSAVERACGYTRCSTAARARS
jgi:hypothetical protein